MSTRSNIINAISLEAGVAILTAALAKPGIGGRTKNRLRRAIPALRSRLAAERRSEASRKAAATRRNQKALAAAQETEVIVPGAITATTPKRSRAKRITVPAN